MTPVDWRAPWVWMVSMVDTIMPRPTCCGLTPPTSSVGFAAPASVWESMSWKVTLPFLKPLVFTLAMLFPSTSIRVWWFWSPETPAQSDRIIDCYSLHRAAGADSLSTLLLIVWTWEKS